jgi:hypothetical protein
MSDLQMQRGGKLVYVQMYRVIINDCSRSRPCPCYEIFAAFSGLSIFVAVTVIF